MPFNTALEREPSEATQITVFRPVLIVIAIEQISSEGILAPLRRCAEIFLVSDHRGSDRGR